MKKLLCLISIIAILITIIGCGTPNFKVSVIDSKTGFPIEGTVSVNGRMQDVSNGTLSLSKGSYKIEKEGYGILNLSINGNENSQIKASMEPTSYLVIQINIQNAKILIDGTERKGKLEGSEIIISPVIEGSHSVSIEAPFYVTNEKIIALAKGENVIKLDLLLDKDKIQDLLNSIEFPEENKNFDFSISITGDVSKNKFKYDLKGTVKDALVDSISDNNVSYTFKNGEPFINNEHVNDTEKAAVLKFARDTIQEFLQFKEKIKVLDAKSVNNNEIIFIGTKEFEGRKFLETVKLTLDKNNISSITLNISSQDLQVSLEAVLIIH